MSVTGFTTLAVIGAGQMGSGIAQVCASKGLKVTVMDLNAEQCRKAQAAITQSLAKLAGKGMISTAEKATAEGNLNFISDFASIPSCDLVIEAVSEKEAIKQEIFTRLDSQMPQATIFASNTSSLPITRLAAATKRPDRFIGMHFMNPVPLMKLVEIIPGLATSPTTTDRIVGLATALGKEVTTSRDFPGFVVNRILMPMINEAFTAFMEGVASAEDIDKGMRLGTNQPMGPLALADFIGLDTCLAIMEVLHKGLGEPRYRPSPLLRQYVEAGWLGRKSQRGVFNYSV